jgi:phosphoribosylaminoimidazolecarboxamide formyltransferase / IMP cyclohydrolase
VIVPKGKNEQLALLSVSDKTGILDLAKALSNLGYKIVSTGGTAKTLLDAKIAVIPIEEVTGNPEAFDGRMKTISFQVESGLLFDRTNPKHVREAKELGISAIDVVVCNLYPFEKENSIENIDVGGPTMIRAAAKNYKSVLVITDPEDYPRVIEALEKRLDLNLREEMAAKAFSHVSFYDSQIARWFNGRRGIKFPQEVAIPGRLVKVLRYGENPHQQGAYYAMPGVYSPLNNIQKLAGRELSLINLTDIYAGLESVRAFKEAAAVIIKHNSPCGIALGKTTAQALERALNADPESAFGGVVVVNKTFDLTSAKLIAKFKEEGRGNMDIVAGPLVRGDALELLTQTRKSTGVYSFGEIKPYEFRMNIKFVDGGYVLQDLDEVGEGVKEWKVVTKKKPTKEQMEQMILSWKFISRIKSNAVIVMDPKVPMTRGIGTGQTSRVRATKIALEQAGDYCKGAILASDSFFPFPDSVTLAVESGIAAIIQQGTSINDELSINEADKAGIPMVLTYRRAFWH